LFYDIRISDRQLLAVMTLTSPYCPAGDVILDGVRAVLERVGGGRAAEVELTWAPRWTPARMSPAAAAQLGWREMEDV
jgi:metal-sulfur cluster biosynthetic enzyme